MPFPIGALGASPPSEVGEAGATATAAQFASGPLRKEARNISRGFSLFYVPTHSVDSMGVWLTSEQKSSSAQSDASRNFAQILAKASESTNRGGPEKYKWYVVGHAAKVFQNALQTYSSFSRKPLGEKHEFFFVDPQVPLGALQNDLRKNGIDFYHDRNVVDESMSLASRMHQFLDPEKVYLDMHRAYSFEREFNVNLKKANKVYADFGKSNVFFSDVVKKMLPLLTGRWR